jgi:O-acetyl-ADP-ribose deacetylase (regulator of RNase III)
MGALCGKPAPEETIITRASVSLKLAYNNVTFENVNGDISDQIVDAIVNAANNQLAHNNGLANTLVVRGGQIIQDESNNIMQDTDGILEVGTAVVTTAGRLQARYIIHVVSPIWNGGDNGEEERLALAVVNALTKADEYNLNSIAVPSISSGSFGFPAERCAEIMVRNTLEYLERNPGSNLNLVRFVNMDAQTVRVFKHELERVLRKENRIEEVDVVELRKTEEIIEQEPNGDIVIEEVVVEEVVVQEDIIFEEPERREVVEEVYVEEVREVVEDVVVEEVVREVVEDIVVEEVVREEVFEERQPEIEIQVEEVRVEEDVYIDQNGNVEVEERVVVEEEEVVLERSPADIVVEEVVEEVLIEENY